MPNSSARRARKDLAPTSGPCPPLLIHLWIYLTTNSGVHQHCLRLLICTTLFPVNYQQPFLLLSFPPIIFSPIYVTLSPISIASRKNLALSNQTDVIPNSLTLYSYTVYLPQSFFYMRLSNPQEKGLSKSVYL